MDEHLELLKEYKFDKQVKKLQKKLKDKKVIIYGVGTFFNKIMSNYDLSFLNIIGVSDRKYNYNDSMTKYQGYDIIPLDKIEEKKPDYILIGTLYTMSLLYDFRYNKFKKSKIKVIPIVDKPFLTLLKEVLA